MGGRRCCGNACVGAEALHRPEASRLLLAALSTMMALTATDAEGVSELLSFLKVQCCYYSSTGPVIGIVSDERIYSEQVLSAASTI